MAKGEQLTTEYHKIPGPFKRYTDGPLRNKVIIGEWVNPEFEYLSKLDWLWTEKVDGTNVRVLWDGHEVHFAGRTVNAHMPMPLLTVLEGLFTEELFEQMFNDTPAILYGEGYGPGINNGGKYRPEPGFILFDAFVRGFWLRRESLEQVAIGLGVDIVPSFGAMTPLEAIGTVHDGLISKVTVYHDTNPANELFAEGLVGVPEVPMFNRQGKRIIMKVKHADFYRHPEL